MALKDMFAFVKNGLEEQFNSKPRDPVAARKPLLKGIDATLDQFTNGRTRVPNKWWVVNNDIVAFSPKLKGTPLVLNGGTTSHIESADFPAFLAAFRHAVEEGELDGEIAAIESGASVAGHSVAIAKPKRASGISPEAARLRGQKAAESRARNKAAREAAKD
ncbi:hypothetical protein [Sphingomonas bacterium]|uniref:hypothetical protein n=1 Tax=Sphingomonas bacterium TaxID=1895847 RepID=UPI001576BE49|nr:hypothetical protein [Sphingomonas bacterium]